MVKLASLGLELVNSSVNSWIHFFLGWVKMDLQCRNDMGRRLGIIIPQLKPFTSLFSWKTHWKSVEKP